MPSSPSTSRRRLRWPARHAEHQGCLPDSATVKPRAIDGAHAELAVVAHPRQEDGDRAPL
jgi:hypothetical protein